MSTPQQATKSSEIPDAIFDYVVKTVEAHLADRIPWEQRGSIHGQVWQALSAFAYLYRHERSPFKGAPALRDDIVSLFRVIKDKAEADNRLSGQCAEARALLGAESAELMPGVDALLTTWAEEFVVDMLAPLKHVSHFVSANVRTSTNHIAVYANSVWRIGQQLGRQDFVACALDVMDRLTADQQPDGYWEETTGGPTTAYNSLTVHCVGRMAVWTGADNFRQAALRGVKFHRRFHYPDTSALESIDGRVRHHGGTDPLCDFIHSWTPEGRAFSRLKMDIRKQTPPSALVKSGHWGEHLALLCESHRNWVEGPVGTAEIERERYTEILREPGAVRKEGPWFVSLQAIKHFPLGFGFTIDRTSLTSLWHRKTGLIVTAGGELGENPGQTFRFKIEPFICHVPERGTISMGAAGSKEPATLVAEYAGGTAHLSYEFVSDQEIVLKARVGTRLDRYPVPFALQLELREGSVINGTPLGKDAKEWSENELQGRLDAGAFSITGPKTMKAVWPHDPYNPYDMVNFRSHPHLYVTLLKVPVPAEGFELRFKIN